MNYHDPKTLLGALQALQVLFETSNYEEHNAIIAEIEVQWPGFQVRRSEALRKYGLFPKATEEEAMGSEAAEMHQIKREWEVYRHAGDETPPWKRGEE